MAKGKSPTQKTLALLRDYLFTVEVVERWNAYARRRQDLFGFIDLIAVRPNKPFVVGVQATSRDNMAARRAKSLELEAFPVWTGAAHFWVIGWKQSTFAVDVWRPDTQEFVRYKETLSFLGDL